MINKYPYTDFNEYNMDWIIKTVKDLTVQWAETHQEFEDVQSEWTSYKNYIDNYFANLDLSQEVSDKIDQMAADGYFRDLFISAFRSDVIAEAGQVTGEWIAANLVQETGYVLDSSLTVANAAADAKAAGDLIYEVNKEDDDLYLKYFDAIPENLVDKEKLIIGYYISASGVQTANADWNCTDFIDISQFTHLSAKNIGLGAYYDSTKTYMSSVTLSNNQNVAIPAGAKWIRVSILPANVDTAIISYRYVIINGVTLAALPYWESPIKTKYDERRLATSHILFTVPVNNTEATDGTGATTNYEGVPNYIDVECALTLPEDYKPVGIPCKLIMFCHGAGRGVTGSDGWFTIASYRSLVEYFTTRGYAVFDCNGFNNTALGKSFWGKEMGVEAWRKAYRYITTHYNVQKDFSIYAFSMGGLTALNMAFQAFPNINAIAMGSPVINLEEVFNSTDGTKAVLQTLYGLGDTWDDSKVIGQNPWKHVENNNNVLTCPYKLPPIKIWYGGLENGTGGNPGVSKYIAQNFITAIRNSGGYAFYREVDNGSHDISYGANPVINSEILTFIERYEKVFPNAYD